MQRALRPSKPGLALALSLLVASCAPDLQTPQDVLVFFDVSCSTQSAEIREKVYQPAMEDFAEEFGRRDRLQRIRVTTMDYATFLNPVWDVASTFDPYDPSDESELGFSERVSRTRAQLRQDVGVLLAASLDEAPDRCQTDVLGAFSKSSVAFSVPVEEFSSASRHLVLFSDMVQVTDELTFNPKVGIDLKDADAVDQFIEQRRNSGSLPQLQNVSVQVYAPGLNVPQETTADRQRRIQEFWTKYVTASGGQITAYGTQPDLP